MSKVSRNCIGFALLRSVIIPENSCHSLNQSDSKPKTNRTTVTRVFPRFMQLTCFYFAFSLAPCVNLPCSD